MAKVVHGGQYSKSIKEKKYCKGEERPMCRTHTGERDPSMKEGDGGRRRSRGGCGDVVTAAMTALDGGHWC